jgi:tetratricopeptide (TPR) repeat protein
MKKRIPVLAALLLSVGLSACTVRGPIVRGFEAFADMNYELAEMEFTEALKDDPNNPYAQLNLAAVYQNTGRPELAIPLYLKVLETGKNIRPTRKANSGDANPTLAELAQTNLLKMQGSGS